MNLKKISIGVFILVSGYLSGQNAGFNQKGIKANFTQKSIEAYQENSQKKLEEFYEYLTMYSSETSPELKNQILSNIFKLTNQSIEVSDFTSDNPKKINLEELLSKIENQSYQFHIQSQSASTEIGFNKWQNSYVLSVSQKEKTVDFKIHQTIYFEPKEKKFGTKTKTVWEIKLGNIQ